MFFGSLLTTKTIVIINNIATAVPGKIESQGHENNSLWQHLTGRHPN